jgi:ubiquinone/menaquinone biosynthesis C-methylase UbiE
MKSTLYDEIGKQYQGHRSADQRIVKAITHLLDLPGKSGIADIGAGTGNYSNALAHSGFKVYAVEPSTEMRSQAVQNENVIWLEGTAESIPLPDYSVDGIVVILALHHFSSLEKALPEFSRICPHGPVVIFSFDPRESEDFWLQEYFNDIWLHTFTHFPPIDELARSIAKAARRPAEIHTFLLPHDLSDRFMAAGWNKPELYLNAQIRKSMSGFALADPARVEQGRQRLKTDLKSGIWDKKFGHLRQRKHFDAGYRFVKLKKRRTLNSYVTLV